METFLLSHKNICTKWEQKKNMFKYLGIPLYKSFTVRRLSTLIKPNKICFTYVIKLSSVRPDQNTVRTGGPTGRGFQRVPDDS